VQAYAWRDRVLFVGTVGMLQYCTNGMLLGCMNDMLLKWRYDMLWLCALVMMVVCDNAYTYKKATGSMDFCPNMMSDPSTLCIAEAAGINSERRASMPAYRGENRAGGREERGRRRREQAAGGGPSPGWK
jgi:hypothetical protein